MARATRSQLFLGRAAAGGSRAVRPDDHERIAAVCRGLDGMALAIELAAARFPSLGLDGLEAGLADRLRLLTGGPRIDDRHRSLRSTLDWSYALLDEPDQAVLRRVSVFAGPFTAARRPRWSADWPPVPAGDVPDHPGRAGRPEPAGRDRGSERHPLPGPGDHPPVRRRAARRGRRGDRGLRRVTWAGAWRECRPRTERRRRPAGAWRAAFDQVADELRGCAGLGGGPCRYRATGLPAGDRSGRPDASSGALPGESQRRYEQAAELAADDGRPRPTPCAARRAPPSPGTSATDALRLRRARADAALRARRPGRRGRRPRPQRRADQSRVRADGDASRRPVRWRRCIAEGRALAADDLRRPGPAAHRRGVQRRRSPIRPRVELIERALALARGSAIR